MMKLRIVMALGVVSVLCVAVACGKKDDAADPTVASAVPASIAPARASAAPSSSAGALGPLGPGETLMGRLSKEASARPALKPTADDVFATFDKLGVSVPQKEQTLGATYKAAYCVGGYTADRTLAVNVCEYASEAAATAGRDLSRSLFPDLPARDVWRQRATTMSIIQQKQDAPTKALEKKLVDAFLAL
jgi:hypothetical protein